MSAKRAQLPGSALLDALDAAEVSKKARTYGLVLARFMNREGECWPAQPTIAKQYGIGPRGQERYLAELVAAGLVGVSRRSGPRGAHIYRSLIRGRDDSGQLITEEPSARASNARADGESQRVRSDDQRVRSDDQREPLSHDEQRTPNTTKGGGGGGTTSAHSPQGTSAPSSPRLSRADVERAQAALAPIVDRMPKAIRPALTDELAAELCRLLDEGWHPELIAGRVSTGWAGVRNPAAVLLARLRKLGALDAAGRAELGELVRWRELWNNGREWTAASEDEETFYAPFPWLRAVEYHEGPEHRRWPDTASLEATWATATEKGHIVPLDYAPAAASVIGRLVAEGLLTYNDGTLWEAGTGDEVPLWERLDTLTEIGTGYSRKRDPQAVKAVTLELWTLLQADELTVDLVFRRLEEATAELAAQREERERKRAAVPTSVDDLL